VQLLKVGELARRAGVSVRTLHYYDEIGLLPPARKSASGHRLYAAGDVARLHQIRSLRQLGLTLDEVRDCLARPAVALGRVLAQHVARLRARIDEERVLCDRLERLAARLATGRGGGTAGAASVDELLAALDELARAERYFTPEQRRTLAERARQMGEARIRRGEERWRVLMAEVRAAMERGADPRGRDVRRLAARWSALTREFTGGDAGIARGVRARMEQETSVHGVDTRLVRDMCAYLQPAMRRRASSEAS